MTVPRRVLSPTGDPISRYVAISGLAHLIAAAGMWAYTVWSDDSGRPLVDPDDVMMVTMAMPKSPDAMPHRAERAPRAAPRKEAPPTPAPTEPSPADDLSISSDDAAPAPTDPTPTDTPDDLDAKRRRLMDLLDEEDAPIGTEDRHASSPDGVDGATGRDANALGDPEYAAYIHKVRQLLLPEFRPIPALRGKGLAVRVLIKTDPTGRIVQRTIATSSGNASWDQAALSATQAIDSLPLPPEPYRKRLAAGYTIEFADDP